MQNILKAEKMDFSNVVRQWNYIENIVGFTGKSQNYQIFNDIRSEYYSKSKFDHGYPSATGIGMDAGGIIVDFIAVREKNNTTIIPIKSPVQSDAHQYSKDVIAFNEKVIKSAETTPKFERAKAMVFDNKCLLFISGTAAIKGQISAEKDSAAAQTKLTIENIFHLVTTENLYKHNFYNAKSKVKPAFFRVYVKNAPDFNSVRATCEKMIHNVPVIYVKADICRPELLVEIEGVFTLDI
jgi:enamine deaminase RidA (YjgF/YER057c/UK114 family)